MNPLPIDSLLAGFGFAAGFAGSGAGAGFASSALALALEDPISIPSIPAILSSGFVSCGVASSGVVSSAFASSGFVFSGLAFSGFTFSSFAFAGFASDDELLLLLEIESDDPPVQVVISKVALEQLIQVINYLLLPTYHRHDASFHITIV